MYRSSGDGFSVWSQMDRVTHMQEGNTLVSSSDEIDMWSLEGMGSSERSAIVRNVL